jgi:hypothetical protein
LSSAGVCGVGAWLWAYAAPDERRGVRSIGVGEVSAGGVVDALGVGGAVCVSGSLCVEGSVGAVGSAGTECVWATCDLELELEPECEETRGREETAAVGEAATSTEAAETASELSVPAAESVDVQVDEGARDRVGVRERGREARATAGDVGEVDREVSVRGCAEMLGWGFVLAFRSSSTCSACSSANSVSVRVGVDMVPC